MTIMSANPSLHSLFLDQGLSCGKKITPSNPNLNPIPFWNGHSHKRFQAAIFICTINSFPYHSPPPRMKPQREPQNLHGHGSAWPALARQTQARRTNAPIVDQTFQQLLSIECKCIRRSCDSLQTIQHHARTCMVDSPWVC